MGDLNKNALTDIIEYEIFSYNKCHKLEMVWTYPTEAGGGTGS
jgi:hypothetical protein